MFKKKLKITLSCYISIKISDKLDLVVKKRNEVKSRGAPKKQKHNVLNIAREHHIFAKSSEEFQ